MLKTFAISMSSLPQFIVIFMKKKRHSNKLVTCNLYTYMEVVHGNFHCFGFAQVTKKLHCSFEKLI